MRYPVHALAARPSPARLQAAVLFGGCHASPTLDHAAQSWMPAPEASAAMLQHSGWMLSEPAPKMCLTLILTRLERKS